MKKVSVFKSEEFFRDNDDIQNYLDEVINNFNINIDNIINIEVKNGFKHRDRFYIYVKE